MARVGKYYGIQPKDAIKFWWLDATFAVERKIDKLHRKSEHCAAGVNKANEEAKNASENTDAAKTTSETTQKVESTTDKKENKPGFFSNIFGKKKSKDEAEANSVKQTSENSEKAVENSDGSQSAKKSSTSEDGGKKDEKKKKKNSSDSSAGGIDSAAKQADQAPVNGFNIGGANFDFNMGSSEMVEPSLLQNDASNSQQNIFQQSVVPPVAQQVVPPAVYQPVVPPVTQQWAASPVTQQPMAPPIAQQPAMPQMPKQPPIHRVDAPPKVIPPKPPRAEADHVEVSNVNVAKPFVDPSKTNKPVKDQYPDIIQTEVPHIADKPSEQLYDNSGFIATFPYLGDIQNIALKHHIQLKMEHLCYTINPMIQTGMILCYAFNDGSNTFNEYKSFTVDTGMIIDRRPKLFKGIVTSGFEDMQAYPIQINDKANKNKTNFNAELFEKIFVGGIAMLDDRGMYSPQYRALNKLVDLSTMPTKLMNGERRKAVQDRLMRAMNAGVFKKAIQDYAPGSRFEFKESSYNKDQGTFVLTNYGVPPAFNSPTMHAAIPIEITFGHQVFIHSPNNPPADSAPSEETNKKAESPKQKKADNKSAKNEKPKAEPAAEEAKTDSSNTEEAKEN